MEDFLSRIGKECGSHVEKFKSWDELFTTSSEKMKKLEIPVKQRRWILHWVEKYRYSIFLLFVIIKKSLDKDMNHIVYYSRVKLERTNLRKELIKKSTILY